MNHFVFKRPERENISAYLDEMFSILAGNMRKIAPTGDSYDEDFQIWREYIVPAFAEGKQSVILIFDGEKLCGYFQYGVDDTTFRMDEIQFREEYRGSGLFSELFHYLTTVIPVQTKYVDAFTHKANLKSQGILKHLGLEETGESKNGKSLYFKGEYKTIFDRYSE